MLRGVLAAVGCAALVALCEPGAASAHPMPGTKVLLDVRETAIEAELLIPTGHLAEASGIDLDLRTELSAEDRAGLASYVRDHVRPATPDGTPWTVRIGDMRLDYTDRTATGPYRELVVQAVLTPPTGAEMRRFVFGYDAVIREVVTHTAIVAVRQDWRAGQVDPGNDARQIGVVRTDAESMTVPPLAVDLADAGAWRGFAGMVALGGRHILEGTDHLLFLFTLLLPAVLVAGAGRWHPDTRRRRAVRHILAVTIAFTLGHSAALIASALTRLEIPARPVETLIAATILVGGAHAVRPLFPGREAVVAGAFGLVHGMAFSFTLAELRLSTGQSALGVLGFNLGIEAVQVLLVALALPPLLVLVTTRAQPVLRVGGALLVMIAALGWAFDRLGFANPIARTADQGGSLLLPIVVIAAVAAVVVLAGRALGRSRVAQQRPDAVGRGVVAVGGDDGGAGGQGGQR
ncbi:HupE/UreJ family protein [Nocardia wallacei]|uniref:HupE/UreJ family protein n=1 Tax=Nocardia wallacei TaxID=480035 RepID=UPI002456A091|nr:HupE/UreJ family protein [Nocardia wallacei]